MTKREAAIVSAYTGYLIGDISHMCLYIECFFNRRVYTHELPGLRAEIREKSKPDFIAIEVK